MADFTNCIEFALQKLGIKFDLKEQQLEILSTLYEDKDCIGVLPTGYGTSLIFQLLPYFMQRKHGKDEPMIVLVVTPLNSIMEDQVASLGSRGFMACYLSYAGKGGFSFEDDADGEDDRYRNEDDHKVCLSTSVTMQELMSGQYHHIYSHPETFMSSEVISSMLRTSVYQDRICGIVIDEVHMVAGWYIVSFSISHCYCKKKYATMHG